ncbi:hypothetical protein HYU18_01970 [Candidatus Woesearchaeota archaeon]|nr:hypothetical protein [Candidatus Woesearchaeota archaeon]
MERLPQIIEAYKADFDNFAPAFIARLTEKEFTAPGTYLIKAKSRKGLVEFPVNSASYIAVVDRLLRRNGFVPEYAYSEEFDNVLMTSTGESSPEGSGIIMFLNWEEPREGTEPLSQVFPKTGDTVMLAYVTPRR